MSIRKQEGARLLQRKLSKVLAVVLVAAAVTAMAPAVGGEEEQQCRHCQTRTVRELVGHMGGVPVYLYWTEHRLPNNCNQQSLVGRSGPAKDQLIRSVSAPEPEYGDAEDQGCVACGNSSACHYFWDIGECHVECPNEGGDNILITVEQALLRGDITEVTKLMAGAPSIKYDNDRQVLVVTSECEPNLVNAVLTLTPGLAVQLKTALDELQR